MPPFSNLRVIDLTHVIAGPFCTYQLAVMGADVIKVEPPDTPDVSRISGAPDDSQVTSDFTAQNANKRAVCIDLKSDDGVKLLRRLIEDADVLVENYRSGAMKKLGLDYAAVKKIRPDIIYCSITGFGQTAPLGERTAYDNVIQAYSGLMAATGDVDSAPLKVGPPVLDYGTGIQAAFAIAAALYQRATGGGGQYIDVAMLDAALMLMSSHVTRLQHSGELSPLTGNNSACNAGYCCYETGDGLLMLGAYTGAQVRNMWRVLGDDEHGARQEKLTPAEMEKYFADDLKRIGDILREKTAAQWEVEFNQMRVPAARVRELDEALTDPQINNRAVMQSPTQSTMPLPTAAFQFAEGDVPKLHSPPPMFGEHTREVLKEIGVDEDEMIGLEKRGVIRLAK